MADVLDSENVDHVGAAGADEVIETRRIGFSMIAQAVGFHGTATTMSGVLLSGAHNVYIGTLLSGTEAPITSGELLVQMQLSKRGGLVIGVCTSRGDEVLNPPKSPIVESEAQLIYLAEKTLLPAPK